MVSQVSHKSKVEQTNVRMQMLQERGELERKRDQLHNQVEGQFPYFDHAE